MSEWASSVPGITWPDLQGSFHGPSKESGHIRKELLGKRLRVRGAHIIDILMHRHSGLLGQSGSAVQSDQAIFERRVDALVRDGLGPEGHGDPAGLAEGWSKLRGVQIIN